MPDLIDDFIAIALPPDVDPDRPDLTALCDRQAERSIIAQYKGHGPRALVMVSTEWTFTSDPDEVEAFQPAHDCAVCRAGNDQAHAFLTEHPERVMALGNLHYIEVW